jgi:hypothetical protein
VTIIGERQRERGVTWGKEQDGTKFRLDYVLEEVEVDWTKTTYCTYIDDHRQHGMVGRRSVTTAHTYQ